MNTDNDFAELSPDEDWNALDRTLQNAKEGDKQAKDQLFSELEGYINVISKQFFNNRLQSKIGVSDVAQQTMLKASENFPDFRGSSAGEFKAWLKVILSNEVRQSEREFFSQKRNVGKETYQASESQVGYLKSIADSLPTPSTRAVGEEQTDQIQEAIDRLPEDYRTVIHLRNWKKLGFKQIGEEMGRSESAVTKLWFRALVSLQEQLGKS